MATTKAAGLKTWTVTKKDGSTRQISAATCEQDGSGLRFRNEDGTIKTAYADGLIASVEED